MFVCVLIVLIGVPWNIHCWSQTVGHAYEKAQKSFLRCLLRDFQSMSADEYTNDFCDDGLVILFNIFKECEVRRHCAQVSYRFLSVPSIGSLSN